MGVGKQFTEAHHLVKGLDPVADAFAGVVVSDAVKMANFEHVTFIVFKGVGAIGTATLTVEAVDNAAGDNPVAIPFRSRAITTGDTPGALTYREAAGFTTGAGSSELYVVEVDAEKLAASGKGWVRLKSTEVVDSPIVGAILIVMSNPKFGPEFATAIA